MAGPGDAVTLVLIGMMGSGRSSVGAALPERSGWPYGALATFTVDTDELDVDAVVEQILGALTEPAPS